MRQKVVFLGNAQARALYTAWSASVAGTDAYENRTVHYSQVSDEDKAAIEGADIIIQQISDHEYYDIDTLNLRAKVIRFPYVNGAFLWPYCGVSHPVWDTTKMHECGAFIGEHGDGFLAQLYRNGIQPSDAIEQYATLDVISVAKIERRYEIGLAMQRLRDEKAAFDVSMSDYIDRHISREILFVSRQRLAQPIFWHLARVIFAKLLRLLGDDEAKSADGEHLGYLPHWGLVEMPIHPKIARHFVLPGISENHEFAINLNRLTFHQYIHDYMTGTFQEELHSGMRMVQRGEAEAAVPILWRGLAAAPRSPEGSYWLSQAYTHLGRGEEALEMARTAVDRDEVNRDFLVALARCYRKQNALDAASAALKRSLEIDPWYPEAHRMLSEVLVQQGQPEQAIALAGRLADNIPSHAFAHLRLGELLLHNNDHAGAEKSFRRAISANERDERAWDQLARLFTRLGRNDEAIALSRVAKNPQDAGAHVALSVVVWRSGRLHEAERELRTAIRLAPQITNYKALLADLLWWMGRPDNAIALARTLVDDDADNALMHALLGLLLWRSGNLSAAAGSYRRAIDHDPANMKYRTQCSLVLTALGASHEAIAITRDMKGQSGNEVQEIQVNDGPLYSRPDNLNAPKPAFLETRALQESNEPPKSNLLEIGRQGLDQRLNRPAAGVLRVYIHANCQAVALADILRRTCPDWCITYFEVHTNDIIDQIDTYRTFVQSADLVISQPIHPGYRGREELSLEWVRANVHPDAMLIIIPSVHFSGHHLGLDQLALPGLLPFSNLLAAHMVAHGVAPDLVVRRMLSDDLLLDAEIAQEIELSLSEVARREVDDQIDIKISPFLEQNCLSRPLFHIYNHPFREVMAVIANLTLELYGRAERVPIAGHEYQPVPHIPPLPAVARFMREHGGQTDDIAPRQMVALRGFQPMTQEVYYTMMVERLGRLPSNELFNAMARRWPNVQVLRRLASLGSSIPGISRWDRPDRGGP